METSIDQDIANSILTETSRSHLKTASGWAMFLAILGAIGVGIMLLAGIVFFFTSSNFTTEAMPFNPAYFSLIYLVLAIIYAIPVYNTFKFSRAAARAASSAENTTLEECLAHLKALFKNMGIMTIVFISLYFVAIIGAVAVGAADSF